MKYSTEYLNSFNQANFPLHKLTVKEGAFVMLIKNLDVSEGLVNGTRLKILKCFSKFIRCQILNGNKVGSITNLIPID